MLHIVDPRQNRLFDPFEGVIPPAGQRIIGSGWQGVVRHLLLELMPVGELALHLRRRDFARIRSTRTILWKFLQKVGIIAELHALF